MGMNILIAADYATPGSGNFVASVLELGTALRQQGDELFFIFPKSPNTTSPGSWVNWLWDNGFTVYLVEKDAMISDRLAELQNIITTHSIDILHIHFGMYHQIIMHHRKELAVKILVHDHMDFSADRSREKQKLFHLLYSLRYRFRNVGVISVNPEKDSACAFARHWYIPNGLSLKRYIDRSRTREECRQELGIRPEEKMCLFLGWDLQRKGLDIALKAIEECRKRDPSVILGIVGVGTPPKEWTLRYITEHTAIDPHSPWIHYLPSTEDMLAYHRAADVYLSASRSEAFSYGILEAISQNTPVAVSDIPGTSWAYEYEYSVSYPVEDFRACADAVQTALSFGKASANSEQLVKKYGIKTWCDRIINVYNVL